MTQIGFISDIHGNYEALTAMLARLEKEGVDMVVCLGDIVGYGASPVDCLHLLQDREIPCVMGNHDEYVQTLMDPAVARLREEVRKSVEWTQTQLSMEDLAWLLKLPYRLQIDENCMCLHSSFASGRWPYCMDEDTFAANFAKQPCKLAFCGHSHSPLIGIELPGQKPFVDFIRSYTLPTDNKIMVNVGSVGQPRDRDPRSCACIFEMETRQIRLIREAYDVEMSQNKIYMARLPDRFALRLEVGR